MPLQGTMLQSACCLVSPVHQLDCLQGWAAVAEAQLSLAHIRSQESQTVQNHHRSESLTLYERPSWQLCALEGLLLCADV